MKIQTLGIALLLILCGLRVSAQPRGLDIYFVDTEGGAATLIVTPQGESFLIDCGNPGERDAGRIAHVAKEVAHLTAIDALITTHWHLDHYGGVEELAKHIPIKKFYDHGIPEKSIDDPDNFPKLIAAYKAASKGVSTTLNPGDMVPMQPSSTGLSPTLRCLCARSEVIPDKPDSGKNLLAKGVDPLPPD
ncbi:MAG TPA: MBL fold metallo-hydrolase, partial [Chthonomonadaceae bacterium]|nr:MBL fold metallo-hydrolase [Chthonomonadaceae bacterium]